MDSQRSAKRRKLDTAPHESQKSSPASRSTATPITYSKKKFEGNSEKQWPSQSQPLTNGTKSTSSAHDAWLEAKAKSKALRGKRLGITAKHGKEVDVFDDIEGAHAHQPPLKKTSTPSTLPAKKQLDPLRNQKSANAPTSSPSKGAATLGFFKQFHSPKPTATKSVPKQDGKTERLVNGVGRHDGGRREDHAEAGAELDSPDSEDTEDELEPASPIRSSGRGSWKGWSYAKEPIKTFEEEIRELADAARQEAEKNDGNTVMGTYQKRRNRTSTSDELGNETPIDERRVAKDVAPKRTQAPVRRKMDRSDYTEPAADQLPVQEDPIEIEDSDHEKSPVTGGMHPKIKTLQGMTPTKARPQHSTKALPTSKLLTFEGDHLRLIQTILLEKLTGKRSIRLADLDVEYAKVSSLVTQTVTAGESNSMLLIGARGSGKTALVNQILREQAIEHPDDFHVVRLSGFIHTDDKIALREIWRQLGREMELDEEETASKNYADTLTTLLALLSHPAELGREQNGQVTKSVIFILDEFELFASHPRQTLLYNLFDIAQSRKAPIAVLGLTTRIDVAESLEKRVKSRFSHRYVHLSLPKSFAEFQENCIAAIAVQSDELTTEEREPLGVTSEVAAKLEKVSKKHKQDATSNWNVFVEQLLALEAFMSHLRRLYYTTKSVSEFHSSMLIPIATLPSNSPTTSDDLMEHFSTSLAGSLLNAPDSKLNLLSSLSTLQLALLICAARLTAIHNSDIVPFAQAYEEYKVIASKAKLQASASGALAQGAGSKIWGKEVAKGAWEELIGCGLVMEDGSRGGRVDVGLEEIGMSGVELGSWGRWCREI